MRLQAGTATDAIVVADADGVLKTIGASDFGGGAWDNPDGTAASQSSTDIIYDSGNVGINTTDATSELDVRGGLTVKRLGLPTTITNNLVADQQALYSYVGDVNAVFISEQDENTGKNGGFTFCDG